MEQRAGHQGLRVAAGHIEEHQIGRRVVEEGRKQAAHPEIHGIDGVARFIVHQRNHAVERARLACLQDGQNRRDGDEDTEEQFAHFDNRFEIKFVTRAYLFGRDGERNDRQCQQDDVAHQVRQGIMAAQNVKTRMVGLPYAR